MNAAHRLPTPAPDPGPHLVPKPPRLNWIILLSLEIVTVGVFGLVWLVVQAAWIKRITGEYRSLVWAIVNLCALPFLLTVALVLGIIAGISGNVSTAAETVRTATQSYRALLSASRHHSVIHVVPEARQAAAHGTERLYDRLFRNGLLSILTE